LLDDADNFNFKEETLDLLNCYEKENLKMMSEIEHLKEQLKASKQESLVFQ
jgi:hypothetical protein